MDISIVIPTYNEEKNVPILHQKLVEVLSHLKLKYEIIFVDDGSTDQTYSNLLELKPVKIIRLRKNFGQSAAMDAGFKAANGKLIVAMDADLQNDPRDIPLLIEKLNQGYDLVSGWRKKRNDSLQKKLFSRFASWLRRKLFKINIHDYGCSLKIYKKECLQNFDLYGEMHRYIPAILANKGFKVGEIKVAHHSRKYGKTKYGLNRIFKGFLDLFYIKFWNDYSSRPLHFFGLLGVMQYCLSGIIFIEQIIKAFMVKALAVGPLLLLGILLVITGTIFIMFGFLGEILIRTYYSKIEDTPYTIKETIIKK
ncbi:MAG: glycosyltransferase family 2 protein [Nanoarchaeota archaeon]|nr:glycosyltransferase family 2 protein [Nanoarchaeota archaeon]